MRDLLSVEVRELVSSPGCALDEVLDPKTELHYLQRYARPNFENR